AGLAALPQSPSGYRQAADWQGLRGWRKALVAPDTTLLETLRILDDSGLQIVLVHDEQRRLLGIVTDGDIRRAIIRSNDLTTPIQTVMERTPFTASPGSDRVQLLEKMERDQIRRVPMLDSEGVVINLIGIEELTSPSPLPNVAVVMAGGLGTRLGSLTATTPKPMMPIGHRPILETILNQLRLNGFAHVYIAVNHRADVIESYFGDGREFGLRLQYLRESERLGTAGPLSLLPARPKQPLLVMNGDLLTRLNFRDLLAYHKAHRAAATLCIGEHHYQVPYGVAKVEDGRIVRLEEKPSSQYLVNAGVYVLNPELLDLIPSHGLYDMPALVDTVLASGRTVAAFPIRDYWFDIGRIEDLREARRKGEAG
ncbi:MAG: nucleotidyltransferase family protein, partial [Gammaproteobacteria bacterium]|nr:nucleotidyltransferase family protein [Gammaproteobacteria bacterium]